MEVKKLPTLPTLPRKKRVAAYARVSTGKDAMLHSLSAQISYYSEYIQKQAEWLYCGVYVDEAVTGTKSERPEFQRLLSDCRAGKINMIVTKSISRFARNTVTLLETVRELKARGIDVYFEEPNIHTMSAAGEMMLTLLASVAQEESRAVSENMKWRVRNNFENGLPWNGTVLGYRIVNGQYVIVPHEAEIVRNIFDMYQSGMGVNKIIQSLNDAGLRTRKGCAWGKCAVMSCLRNYAYTGNLLLQKTYRQDHISKQFCFNRGELPMYHAEGTHEPIIPMEQFEAVQRRLSRQADKHAHPGVTPNRYPFSGKIVCAICGKKYRRKVTATGPVWICSTYNNKGRQYCASKQIPEDTLCRMTAAVLHMCTFDAGAFQDRVKSIDAEPGNTLRFRLFDGTESVVRWQDKSRRDSWTPEMKEKAREKYYGSCNQNTGDEEQVHIKNALGIHSPSSVFAGIGENLMLGLWNGISDSVGWILDKVRDFGGTLIDTVKSVFGISSPSKVFADEIGKNLGLGVGVGFEDAMRDVSKDMADAIPTDFDVAANVHGAPEVMPASGGGISLTLNIENFHNYRSEDINELADELSVILAAKMNRKAAAF